MPHMPGALLEHVGGGEITHCCPNPVHHRSLPPLLISSNVLTLIIMNTVQRERLSGDFKSQAQVLRLG